MNCANCGSQASPLDGYCPICGATRNDAAITLSRSGPVATLAGQRSGQHTRNNSSDPASTNPSAGTFCGRCGSAVSATSDFCGICGNPLNESTLQRIRQAMHLHLPPTPIAPLAASVPPPVDVAESDQDTARLLRIFGTVAAMTFIFLVMLILIIVIRHPPTSHH